MTRSSSFDAYVASTLQFLKDIGDYNDTVIIINSDHGSEWRIDQRLPLLVRFPKQEHRGRVIWNVQRIDIAPTVVDYLGGQIPVWMTGRSLIGPAPNGRRPVFSFLSAESDRERPPFYHLEAVQVALGDQLYRLDLSTEVRRTSRIAGHTAPIEPGELKSMPELEQVIVRHLAENGYDEPFEFGQTIHVRWVDNLDDAQRTALEQSLGLFGGRHNSGSTWRYQVPDVSPERFETIVAHDLVVDSYGFDRATDARFGPVIHVRWVDTLGDAQRSTIERTLGLYRAEHREGATWRYQIPDPSPQRLRTIVDHDMVADTNGFDRGSLELHGAPEDAQGFTDHRLTYASGWYRAESDTIVPESTWRWTQQSATLSFVNLNTDVAFYLDYAGQPDAFANATQTVTIRAGDEVLRSFVSDTAARHLRRIPIPSAMLGTGETAEIKIAVDRTFVPATLAVGERDERELGIQVYHAFIVLR